MQGIFQILMMIIQGATFVIEKTGKETEKPSGKKKKVYKKKTYNVVTMGIALKKFLGIPLR